MTAGSYSRLLETGTERHDFVPAALAPGKPPPARPQPEAIEAWGQRVLRALPEMLPDAALDILRKAPPSGGVLPVTTTTIEAIRDTLLGLGNSYLAVQGPPGTGKTYTGARVIRDLVENHGWKIVSSRSRTKRSRTCCTASSERASTRSSSARSQGGRRRHRALAVAVESRRLHGA